LVIGYRTRLAACQRLRASGFALAATAMTVALPPSAAAQRAEGSIGVSLTIVPPTAAQVITLRELHIDRDGMVTVRTAAPSTTNTSRLVMTRVASSMNAFLPDRYVPALPCDRRETECAGSELRFRVDVGRPEYGVAPRDVHLRIEWLVVAGT
jgi:hypothetical protein